MEYDTPLVLQSIHLIPTEKLIKELFTRYDHAVFSGTKQMSRTSGASIRRWKGNAHTCAGLASDVGHIVLEELHNVEDDMSMEDV